MKRLPVLVGITLLTATCVIAGASASFAQGKPQTTTIDFETRSVVWAPITLGQTDFLVAGEAKFASPCGTSRPSF